MSTVIDPTTLNTSSPTALAAIVKKAAADIAALHEWARDDYAEVSGVIQDHNTYTSATTYVDLGQFGDSCEVEIDEVEVNLYREECDSLKVEPCDVIEASAPLNMSQLEAMGETLGMLADHVARLGGPVNVEPRTPEVARMAYAIRAMAADWAGNDTEAAHVLACALTVALEATPRPAMLATFDPADIEADGGEAHDESARSEFAAPAPVEF